LPSHHQVTTALIIFKGMLVGALHPCEHCNPEFAEGAAQHMKRLATIEAYRPHRLHPELYTGEWMAEWFAAELAAVVFGEGDGDCTGDDAPASAYVNPVLVVDVNPTPAVDVNPTLVVDGNSAAAAIAALHALLREEAPGVWSFPMFTPEFCTKLLEELDHFTVVADARGLPIRRPNTMNSYGVIINEIGMELAIDELQALVLQPISQVLFPTEGGQFDGHRVGLC
jgi:hypothetical protein